MVSMVHYNQIKLEATRGRPDLSRYFFTIRMDFMLWRACKVSLACGRGSDRPWNVGTQVPKIAKIADMSCTYFFRHWNFSGLFSGVMLGHGKLVIYFAVVINIVRFLRSTWTIRRSSFSFHCRSEEACWQDSRLKPRTCPGEDNRSSLCGAWWGPHR